MFTILPSLYLAGIRYFRLWQKSYYHEERIKEVSEINNNNVNEIPKNVQTGYDQQRISSAKIDNSEYISDTNSERSHSSGLDRKKSSRRYRKKLTGELSHKDIGYLIKHTEFTEENIRLWYQDFLRDCPDGKLSKHKFIEIYQQFYRKGCVTKFCNHAFGLFDKHGSGYMEFTEFLLAVSLTSSKDPVRKIELFFAMYDIDHNGLIDENEMRSVVESVYELMGIDVSDPSRIDSKVHEIFSKAQCDSSGYLGKEQFAKACENDRHIRKLLMPTTKSTNH